MTAGSAVVWTAIVAIALGTFGLRFSMLYLVDRVETIPDAVETALGFVPAAVLAALVAPALLAPDGSLAVAGNERLVAGAVAAVVAWRTESILATAIVGVVALVAVQQLL